MKRALRDGDVRVGGRDAAGSLRDLVQPCAGLGNIGSGPVDAFFWHS